MKPLFLHTGVYGPVFAVTVAVFALQQLPALRSTIGTRLRGADMSRDRGSYLVVQGLTALAIFLGYETGVRLAGAEITTGRSLVFFLGIGLMLAGSIISWWAVRALGRSFTVVVSAPEDGRIVQSGPYRFVRHPSYCGQLAFFFGLAVTLTNWVSIPAVMLCVIPAYLYRITVEERMLREELGQPYADYTLRTRRLIPNLW